MSAIAVLADERHTILKWVPVEILAVAGWTLLLFLATVAFLTWLAVHRARRSAAAHALHRGVGRVCALAGVLSTPAGARREAARLRRHLDEAHRSTAASLAAGYGPLQGLSELSLLVNELGRVADSWKSYLASLVREPDEIAARAALEQARPDVEGLLHALRTARAAVTQLTADTISSEQAGLNQRLQVEAEVLGARGQKYRELTGR